LIAATLKNVKEIVGKTVSINNILEWQKHIVRGFQKEMGLRDFVMKTHSEWFAKRGISNHIDRIFYKDDGGTISKKKYVTLIENCKQDAYAVRCIFKHIFKQIKFDFTGVSKIYDISDNAACYSDEHFHIIINNESKINKFS
jgi:hypothetical protein